MDELFDTFRHIEKSLSATVRINHSQVLQITIAELMSKYKAHQGNDVYTSAFETILKGFYLTDKEFGEMLSEVQR